MLISLSNTLFIILWSWKQLLLTKNETSEMYNFKVDQKRGTSPNYITAQNWLK